MVGSLRYLVTLQKYRLFYYIFELYPTNFHCCAIPNPNTLFRYTQLNYVAEVKPNLLICRAMSNPNTLLMYSQDCYIAELYPILVRCRTIADLNLLLSALYDILIYVVVRQSESSITSPNSKIKNRPGWNTNRQRNTDMYLYGQKLKTIAINRSPVDQSSCISLNELIHKHQVCKKVP